MANTPIKDLEDTVDKLSDSVTDLSKIVDKLGTKFVSSVKATNDLGKSIQVSVASASSLVNTFLKFKDVSNDSVKSMQKFREISTRISKDVGLRGVLHNGLYREHLESEERILSTKIRSLDIEEKMGQTMKSRMSNSGDLTKFERDRLKLNQSIERNQSEQNKQLDIARELRNENLRLDIEIKQTSAALAVGVDPLTNAKIVALQGELKSNKTKIEDSQSEIRRIDRVVLKNAAELLELEKAHGKELLKTLRLEKLRAGYGRHLKDTASDLLKVFGDVGEKASAFLDKFKIVPLRFLVLDGLLISAVDRFVQLDKAAEKFRRETGFTTDQMADIRTYAQRVNVEFADMGVSIEKAYDAAKALTEQFQMTSLVTEEATKNVALMSANLNVAEGDSAQVLTTFQGLGGMTEKMAFNVMKVGAGMSNKIGVPFSLVMKDIANASEQTISMLSANPTMLMRSAIAARTLGTDLNKITSSQRKLLDFSSSINDELEVSALLGTSVSFQKSRQLAYDRKIEDAAKATLETVKSAGDFDQMSVYQREALAKAAGMELKDLSKMMSVDKRRGEIERNGTAEQKAKLAMQEEELKRLNKINDLSEQSLATENEAAIRQQKMQGIITNLKNTIDAIVISMADILEPIITPLAKVLVPTLKLVGVLFRYLGGVIKFFLDPIVAIADRIGKWADGLKVVASKVSYIKDEVRDLGYYFGDVGECVLSVGKILISLAAGGYMMGLFFGKLGFTGFMKILQTPFTKMLGWAKAGMSTVGGLLGKIPGVSRLKNLFTRTPTAPIPGSGGFIGPVAPGTGPAGGVGGAVARAKKAGTGMMEWLTNLGKGIAGLAKGIGDAILGLMQGVAKSISTLGKEIGNAISGLATGVGKGIATIMEGIAKGIGYMGNPAVLKGALGIAAVGVAIIPFAYAMSLFTGIDWKAIVIGALALIGFSAVAAALSFASPLIIGGSVAIGILGVALLPFAAAAIGAGYALKLFSESINNSVEPVMKLATLDLTKTALGIGALSVALGAFGAGSAAAGLNSFVGSLLGGDPIAKMEKLAGIGPRLKIAADSITSISQAASQFSSINSFADAIVKLADSLGKLNGQLSSMNVENLNKLQNINVGSKTQTNTQTQASTPTATDLTAVVTKLDEIYKGLVGGKICVYLDRTKISGEISGLA